MNANYDCIKQFVDYLKGKSEHYKIYIFGAGLLGDVLGSFLEKNEIPYSGYIDNAYKVLNEKFSCEYNKPVYGIHEINKTENLFIIITAITARNCNAIHNQLREFGIPDNDTYNLVQNEIVFDVILDISTYNKYSEYTKKLAAFKDKYAGHRAFIIGNGPSLKLEDLNKLENEYCFACNSIVLAYDKIKWRPSFYFSSDPISVDLRFGNSTAIAAIIQQTREHFFVTNIFQKKMFCYRDNPNLQGLYFTCENKVRYKYQQLNTANIKDNWVGIKDDILSSDECYFSDDCSKMIYTFGTIAYNMLQMAVYMGFKEIFLLGIDNSYASSGNRDNTKDYCELLSDGKAVINGKCVMDIFDVRTDLMTIGYHCAKKYADQHGIKIYNATRGGKLEVFPRVDFDSLFAE